MKRKPHVLFICTGNVFRSMSAEYALRAACGAELEISSAGTTDPPHGVLDWVRDYHLQRGVDVSTHEPRRLTPEILDAADLTVAMSVDHQARIEKRFDLKAPLFNEIAFGRQEALLDLPEVIENWRENMDQAVPYVFKVIDHIYNGMPGFRSRMADFLSDGAGP